MLTSTVFKQSAFRETPKTCPIQKESFDLLEYSTLQGYHPTFLWNLGWCRCWAGWTRCSGSPNFAVSACVVLHAVNAFAISLSLSRPMTNIFPISDFWFSTFRLSDFFGPLSGSSDGLLI